MTIWLRRLSTVATVLVTVLVLVRYRALPDTIPVHFDFSGEADDWGPRTTVLFLSLLMVACIGGSLWASRHPDSSWFNYPKEVTEENAQQLYRAGEQLMVWLSVALVWIYAGMSLTLFTGFNATAAVGPGLIVLLVSTGAGIVKTVRA